MIQHPLAINVSLLRCKIWHYLNFDSEQDILNVISDDDDIKAISFVGPNAVSYSSIELLLRVAVFLCLYEKYHKC